MPRKATKKQPKSELNMMQLMERFGSDEKCHAYLEQLRWPEGVRCPRCSSDKISRIHERKQFMCDGCTYQFSVRVGTIFHDSHLPLSKWFVAIYLMGESLKGVSANQLKRTLGVSYKTAWYLCHRIRAAVKDADNSLLSGIVEVDETFVGGRRRGVGSGNRDNKNMVLGAIERGGKLRLKLEKRPDRKTLHTFIKANVSDDAEAIMTDEWPAYRGCGDADTRHETVNHREKEWVRGECHTNTVESAWSLFKRSVVGSYHQISAKHLERYLHEFEFRFNNRNNPYLFRDTLLRLIASENLEYKELTKDKAA